MEAPALLGDLDATTLATILAFAIVYTTGCIKTDPARTGAFAFGWKIM